MQLKYCALSAFFQEEEFTGFGTTTVCPKKTSVAVPHLSFSQEKCPKASDHSKEAKPLIGKIIPKNPKSSLIGKIVPRIPKEDQGVKENQEKESEIPKDVIKLQGKRTAPAAKAKHADKQAKQTGAKSSEVIKKPRETAHSGMQNQTATTSAGGTKQNKSANVVTAALKGTEKTQSRVKEEGEVSEDSDSEQFPTRRSVKRSKAFEIGQARRTSQLVPPPIASFQKRQKKRIAKGMGASPEAGAEAGAQSGEEAAMPLECEAAETSEKRANKRPRKCLFGYRRKTKSLQLNKLPKRGRCRTRRVFYTYEPEPIPAAAAQDGNELLIQDQNVTPSQEKMKPFSEQVGQSSSNSCTPLTSARSSRVIKAPKRFLDEEMIPFPKGNLSTWLKSQQKEDGKTSASLHEAGYEGNSLQSHSDARSVFDCSSAVSKISSKPSPGTSHLEFYKNLKKLTLKLAEKKKSPSEIQEDYAQDGDSLTSHVRKRRRPKLMMEEMDSPGVVRKLAVMVNTDVEANVPVPSEDTDASNNSKDKFYDIAEFYQSSWK